MERGVAEQLLGLFDQDDVFDADVTQMIGDRLSDDPAAGDENVARGWRLTGQR